MPSPPPLSDPGLTMAIPPCRRRLPSSDGQTSSLPSRTRPRWASRRRMSRSWPRRRRPRRQFPPSGWVCAETPSRPLPLFYHKDMFADTKPQRARSPRLRRLRRYNIRGPLPHLLRQPMSRAHRIGGRYIARGNIRKHETVALSEQHQGLAAWHKVMDCPRRSGS